jgi:transposase-like protein
MLLSISMVTEPTTREMRGMAMANSIGRRNNPDVSIKRLNKLTYKVKSQSSDDKWYTVIKVYNTGWTCDCLDYTFRHDECKHIHAVKFSKLLKKKIYYDTFADKPIIESKVGEIVCQRCGSTNYKKFGIRHNMNDNEIQRYKCKDCLFRFVINPAFEKSRASARVITAALDLYFKGVSFRKVAHHLKQLYNFSVNCSSVCRWIRKFVKLVQPYVDSFVPTVGGVYHVDDMMLHVRNENNEVNMTLDNYENHTHKQFDNHYSWLWNLIDSTTRFWICSKISQKRDTHAGVELLREMKQRAPLPKAFVHDGLRTYDEAYQEELFTLKNPRIQNIRSIGSSHSGLNSKVERLNGTVRDRESVMRGLDHAESTQELLDAMRIHYNFIRPHQALGGQTPAEVAGINLNLGENRVEELMRQAALKKPKEMFVRALGIRANKIEIIHENGNVKIKPKEGIDKKNWREINDILRIHDFKWFGDGKESCWIRAK